MDENADGGSLWRRRLEQALTAKVRAEAVPNSISIESIHITDSGKVELLFKTTTRPHIRYGYRFPDRPDASEIDETPESWANVIMARLIEEVDAADIELPDPTEAGQPVWIEEE